MNKLIKRYIVFIALTLIFLLGFFIRFYELSKIPNGFHIDEAINGVNGYFILNTGKDTNNNKFPLQTEVFGDYNPTGYSYLSILPINFLGLNEFSTRAAGAFLGSLTVLASFLLAFSFFRNKRVSLLSAFLVAISPWHIVFSRSSEETLVSLFFIVLGFALIFLSFENKNLKFLIPGVILLAISYFMYFTPRVFIPLLLLSILIYLSSLWYKQKNKKYRNFLLVFFVFLGILSFLLIFIAKGGGDRFKQVSIFGAPGIKLLMDEQIREDGVVKTPVKITQAFHNKVINYSLSYISNYVDYFSGKFLFMEGGFPMWFKVEGMGMIYIIELPFLLMGLIFLLISKNKMHKIPLLWLFIAPLVAAVTIDDIPNIRRSLIMFPVIEIISAFGFLYILQDRKKIKNALIVGFTTTALIFNFLYFFHQYFVHAGIHKNWYRNEGFGEMIKAVKSSYDDVDKIIVTKGAGGIYPLILFYMNYSPSSYLMEGFPKDKEYTGFGKFFFVPQACPSQQKDNRFPIAKKTIYIDMGICGVSARNQKVIYRKDGSKIFNIVYE